jgi:HSP20 family protein
MTLIRWQPAREMTSLHTEMNRIFGSLFDSPTLVSARTVGTAPRRWIPAMDLVENDTQYVLRADLPGVSLDDVAIEIENDVLTISGERRSEREERYEGGYRRVERASGSFVRSVTLPTGVDAEKIEAAFADGVLEVAVPKPAQSRPHRVTITAAAPRTIDAAQDAPVETDDAPAVA